MNERYWLAMAMESYGGSFVVALAYAIRAADSENYQKIRTTFSDILAPYVERAAQLKAQDDKLP